jgi:hypothetical protein
MRVFLTTKLLFITVHLLGQADYRSDTSRKAIDSLFNELSILSKVIEKHGVDIPISVSHFKWLIKTYDNDSTAIFFYNDSGRLMFRKVNRYDKQKCRWWDATEVYNPSDKLIYKEGWKWSCLKASEKADPEVKYFGALLYEKERFKYDSLGRLSERVWWYAPISGVRKYNYVYDNNNKQTYILTKCEEALFWE